MRVVDNMAAANVHSYCNVMKIFDFYHAVLCIVGTMLSQDVCPSVCPLHGGIVSKLLNISSNFFRRVAMPF